MALVQHVQLCRVGCVFSRVQYDCLQHIQLIVRRLPGPVLCLAAEQGLQQWSRCSSCCICSSGLLLIVESVPDVRGVRHALDLMWLLQQCIHW